VDWAAVAVIVVAYAACIYEGELHSVKQTVRAQQARIEALERYIVSKW